MPRTSGVAVDGKERKLAKAGGKKKVHLLAAVTHVPGLVIAQDRVAKAGKANEVTHLRPPLEPWPLHGALVTSDAMQATRDNALYLRKVQERALPVASPRQPAEPERAAQRPALGNDPGRGRHQRAQPRPHRDPHHPRPAALEDTGFEDVAQAILIQRYTTYKKKGQWHTRAEAVLYITSLTAQEATPDDLLAHVRGHWRVEHAHWLRDVIWKEDKSLIRTGNGPQVWSAIINLVITLFRIHGVTSYTEETRLCAQDPRRALRLLDLTRLLPG